MSILARMVIEAEEDRRQLALPLVLSKTNKTRVRGGGEELPCTSASRNSLDISLAYPPVPSPLSSRSTVRNSAPRLLACSATAALHHTQPAYQQLPHCALLLQQSSGSVQSSRTRTVWGALDAQLVVGGGKSFPAAMEQALAVAGR